MFLNSVLVPCSVIDIQTDLSADLIIGRRVLKAREAFDQPIHCLRLNGCHNQTDQLLKLFLPKCILRNLRTIEINKTVRIIRNDGFFRLLAKGIHPKGSREHTEAEHSGNQFCRKMTGLLSNMHDRKLLLFCVLLLLFFQDTLVFLNIVFPPV